MLLCFKMVLHKSHMKHFFSYTLFLHSMYPRNWSVIPRTWKAEYTFPFRFCKFEIFIVLIRKKLNNKVGYYQNYTVTFIIIIKPDFFTLLLNFLFTDRCLLFNFTMKIPDCSSSISFLVISQCGICQHTITYFQLL